MSRDRRSWPREEREAPSLTLVPDEIDEELEDEEVEPAQPTELPALPVPQRPPWGALLIGAAIGVGLSAAVYFIWLRK